LEKSIHRIERAATQRGNGQVDAKRVLISTSDFGSISPFLRFSEDWFRAPGGFETHPHRGMQTVTLVLEGALHHRDHTGADGVLRQGDVQWMTAGRGVLHSEMPYRDEPAHTLQLWLNLPAAMKGLPARYVDQPRLDVPVRKLPGVEILVFAGRSGEIDQPHGSDWPLTLLDIRMEAGAEVTADIPSDWRGFLYVLEGKAQVGPQAGAHAAAIEAPDMAWFEPSAPDGLDRLSIKAASAFRVLLFAGPPIDEPVVAYGPFVMNTPAEIQQAFSDYQNGRLQDGPPTVS
jgi:redox-sensitive bicupin YhaK (pirin superfamily)